MNTRPILIVAALACGGFGTAHAADFPINYAIPDARLDTMRGGYDIGGLVASLGLERTVLINGDVAVHQSVQIPNVATMTIDQANQLSSMLSTTVVTNGVTSRLPSGTASGLVLQNTLDNQTITATTRIDAAVNTAGMLQNMRIDESIKDAVIQFRGN